MGHQWTGQEWQSFCLQLLHLRYRDNSLQVVPDQHQGDLGIEAFSRNDGCVFQCYAPQGPLTVSQEFDAQRKKLTRDVAKIKQNAVSLGALIGAMTIQTYVFLVPQLRSRHIVAHARSKEVEMRSWGISLIARDIAIQVATDDEYSEERQVLNRIPENVVPIRSRDELNVEDWSNQDNELRSNAISKISQVLPDESESEPYWKSLATYYLQGEDALASMREKYPDVWAQLLEVKSKKEIDLALRYPTSTNTDTNRVMEIQAEVKRDMQTRAPTLPEHVADTLSWSAIADWLMRCPLNLRRAQ